MDLSQYMSVQPKGIEGLLDHHTGAILCRHPSLKGIPDLLLEGHGCTLEFIRHTLLCLDI